MPNDPQPPRGKPKKSGASPPAGKSPGNRTPGNRPPGKGPAGGKPAGNRSAPSGSASNRSAASGSASNRSSANRKFTERQAAKQQAARAARQARNRTLGIASIVIVVVIVAVLIVVKIGGGGGGNSNSSVSSPAAGTPVTAAITKHLTSVPLSTLAAAPTSGVASAPGAIKDAKLTADGKPELLFIGAEFCPICATERWAMYVALSKFGTFSPAPGRLHSAVRDGDIPTITFYGTKYPSRYLTFTPVETTTNEPDGNYYVTLQTPTPTEQKIWESHTDQSFPFLDFAGKEDLTTAQFDPSLLEQGVTFDQIAADVGNNSTTVGGDIDASAKVLIQTICSKMTGAKPATVCRAVGNG